MSRNQVLLKFGITDTEMLDAAEMKYRWPQMRTDDMLHGLYHSGGPWMPTLFAEVFQERTRLEPRVVYFYKLPDGDASLAFPNIPNWSFPENGIYGFPSIENEGFKVAPGYAPDSVPDIEKAARDTGMPVARVRGCQFTRSIRSMLRCFASTTRNFLRSPARDDAVIDELALTANANRSSVGAGLGWVVRSCGASGIPD